MSRLDEWLGRLLLDGWAERDRLRNSPLAPVGPIGYRTGPMKLRLTPKAVSTIALVEVCLGLAAGPAVALAQPTEPATAPASVGTADTPATPAPHTLAAPLEVAPASAAAPEPEVIEDESYQVVVTGTLTEKRIEDAPVRTQVVTSKQMETRQARNLADGLRYTSGLRVEDNCTNCGFTEIRINGLEGKYTQVLIDGMQTYSTLAGVYGLEQIPAEMIDRIEVVKGGGSALYGSSAIAGVVNVITKKPKQSFATALVSSDLVAMKLPALRATANGAIVSDNRKMGLHLFGTVFRREPGDFNGDNYSDIVRLQQFTTGAQGFIEVAPKAELQLKFHGFFENRRGGEMEPERDGLNAIDLPPHDTELTEQIQSQRLHGELRWKHAPAEWVDYTLGYVIAYTERNSYYGGGGQSSNVDPPDPATLTPAAYAEWYSRWQQRKAALGAYGVTKNPLHVADAHANFYIHAAGEQIVTVGIQGQFDGVDDRYVGYARKIVNEFSIVGAYAQHDWLFTSWGESILGVRVDKHSAVDSPVVSPRLALMFKPGAGFRLRTAATTGFRAPQAFDEDLHIALVGGTGRFITNQGQLKVERSYSVTQQVEYQADLPGGWVLRTGLTGYATWLTNAFVLETADDPSTPETEVIRTNRGTTRVAGGEWNLDVRLHDLWLLSVGFNVEDARNQDPDPDFGLYRLPRTPVAYGYAEMLGQYEGFEWQVGLNLTGPMLTPRYGPDGQPEVVNRSPWFPDTSVMLAYRVKFAREAYVRPFISVRNVFSAFQTDLPVGPLRDSGYIYGPLAPRSLLAGVSAGF